MQLAAGRRPACVQRSPISDTSTMTPARTAHQAAVETARRDRSGQPLAVPRPGRPLGPRATLALHPGGSPTRAAAQRLGPLALRACVRLWLGCAKAGGASPSPPLVREMAAEAPQSLADRPSGSSTSNTSALSVAPGPSWWPCSSTARIPRVAASVESARVVGNPPNGTGVKARHTGYKLAGP